MEDRRQMRRFTLQLPCMIYDWKNMHDELLFEARTINISTGGALLETDQRLPVGMPVHVNLLIRRNGADESMDTGGCVSLSGRVVRAGETGLGLVFDEEYRIMRTMHLFGQCNAVSHWLRQTKVEGNTFLSTCQ